MEGHGIVARSLSIRRWLVKDYQNIKPEKETRGMRYSDVGRRYWWYCCGIGHIK